MPETVVDKFKVVDIQKTNGKLFMSLQMLLQAVHTITPVVNAGERIRISVLLKHFDILLMGNIIDNAGVCFGSFPEHMKHIDLVHFLDFAFVVGMQRNIMASFTRRYGVLRQVPANLFRNLRMLLKFILGGLVYKQNFTRLGADHNNPSKDVIHNGIEQVVRFL